MDQQESYLDQEDRYNEFTTEVNTQRENVRALNAMFRMTVEKMDEAKIDDFIESYQTFMKFDKTELMMNIPSSETKMNLLLYTDIYENVTQLNVLDFNMEKNDVSAMTLTLPSGLHYDELTFTITLVQMILYMVLHEEQLNWFSILEFFTESINHIIINNKWNNAIKYNRLIKSIWEGLRNIYIRMLRVPNYTPSESLWLILNQPLLRSIKSIIDRVKYDGEVSYNIKYFKRRFSNITRKVSRTLLPRFLRKRLRKRQTTFRKNVVGGGHRFSGKPPAPQSDGDKVKMLRIKKKLVAMLVLLNQLENLIKFLNNLSKENSEMYKMYIMYRNGMHKTTYHFAEVIFEIERTICDQLIKLNNSFLYGGMSFYFYGTDYQFASGDIRVFRKVLDDKTYNGSSDKFEEIIKKLDNRRFVSHKQKMTEDESNALKEIVKNLKQMFKNDKETPENFKVKIKEMLSDNEFIKSHSKMFIQLLKIAFHPDKRNGMKFKTELFDTILSIENLLFT